ncbi:MAG: BrnT family toxin [Aestuariivirga sp.]
MIDWHLVQGFEWDEGNARKNADKHNVSQAEAEQVFFNSPLLLLPDPRHSLREKRLYALGKTDEAKLLLVSFTLRASDTQLRVISARPMNRKEREIYEKANEDNSQISK